MTREIKFRGKRLDNGQWIYGNLIVAENGAPYIFPPEICEIDGHHLRQGDDTPHWVDPATVGQFTGRKDKNSQEIYEDDILAYYSTPYRREAGVVVWDNLKVQFIANKPEGAMFYIGWDTSYKEILGNIHDNPELLKK